jgi:hypothetical protein
VFKELSAELDGRLAALETVLGADLAAFNRTLSGRGLPPVDGAARP